MTARSTWKARERDTARRLGGIRKPVSGRTKHEADVETPLFCVQHKHGRSRPSYLAEWLAGICGVASDAGKIGIVVWSAKHEAGDDAIVLMRLKHFEELCGKIVERDKCD